MSRHSYSDTSASQHPEWQQSAARHAAQQKRGCPDTLVFHLLVPGVVGLMFFAIGGLTELNPLQSIARNAVYSIAGPESRQLPRNLDSANAVIAARPEILALRREGVVENIAIRFNVNRRLWL